MSDIKNALREAHGRFHAPHDSYERWLRVHERRTRNRRVTVGLLAAALALGVIVPLVVVALRAGDRSVGVLERGPAANGRIAYADGSQLFTIRPDGTGKTEVPTPPGGAWLVSWSPDGAQLAVTIFPTAEGPRNVWVMKADGSDAVRVASGVNVSQASWAPDGTRLAIAVAEEGESAIHVVSADGSEDHVVGPRIEGRDRGYLDVAWSPDGTRIAFSRGTDAAFDIFVMDADGSNVVQLSHDGHDYNPAWSPDGRRIAFTRQGTGPQSDIYVMDADGSDVRRLTNDSKGRTNLDPQWSPDGRRIAYIAGRKGGPGPLMATAPDDSHSVTLVQGALVGFSWQSVRDVPSPSPTESPLKSAGTPDSSPAPATQCEFPEIHPTWLPWLGPRESPPPPSQFHDKLDDSATLYWDRPGDNYVRLTRQPSSIEGSGQGEPVAVQIPETDSGQLYEGETPGSEAIYWSTGQGPCSEVVLELVTQDLTRAESKAAIAHIAQSFRPFK
jgi:WD40 repeat protein